MWAIGIIANGVQVGTVARTGTLNPGSFGFVIGSANAVVAPTPFTGSIDEVALYDHALSAGRVLVHAQAAGLA